MADIQKTEKVLNDVLIERVRQDDRWGEQNHPVVEVGLHHGGFETYAEFYKRCADQARVECDDAAKNGTLTWRHIAKEEFYEALAEVDTTRQREELVQLAAVIVACIESVDRNG